jgi:photosystem II stability/assembly factor-like uncharacterized protein
MATTTKKSSSSARARAAKSTAKKAVRRPGTRTARSARRVVVLIATRKGAWLLHGDAARRSWRTDGPHFLGHIVHHLVLDPRDGRTLLAAAKTGHLGPTIFRSTDFGKTWTSLAKGIPVGPVNVIREDPVNKDILYVGTDMGAYVTIDGGKTWTVLGGNLPTVYVHDLVIHPRDNIIVIATHGRGMWALDANTVNNKSSRRRFNYED